MIGTFRHAILDKSSYLGHAGVIIPASLLLWTDDRLVSAEIIMDNERGTWLIPTFCSIGTQTPTATRLWREIQGMGYRSSYTNVVRFLAPLRLPVGQRPSIYRERGTSNPAPSPRQVAMLFLQRPERLTAAQWTLIVDLCEADEAICRCPRNQAATVSAAIRQQGYELVPLQIANDCPVAMAARPRPVIDSDHAGRINRRERRLADKMEQRLATDGHR